MPRVWAVMVGEFSFSNRSYSAVVAAGIAFVLWSLALHRRGRTWLAALGVAIYAINAEGNITQSAALSGIAILIIMLGNLALRFVTKDRRSVS